MELTSLNEKLDAIIKFLGIVEDKKEKVKIKLEKTPKVDELDAIEAEEIAAIEENFMTPAKEKAPRKSTKKIAE
jgi:hypothetical protein